ncbi:hypothetical protein NEOLEDRAFT_1181577 [Neolentinus lepideus HHB14362 ss-1]|uniref:BTB domain-containing protein n=1 Tax=Neolentinus lepideus HHB14362 ss-1 TaxID=1314782 RepID=A0A165PVT7_9AGAM|nr:hypothetical protein NEOLEDRAFT_1181577 [Neolentinus lepideus HHB14362 ss-1]
MDETRLKVSLKLKPESKPSAPLSVSACFTLRHGSRTLATHDTGTTTYGFNSDSRSSQLQTWECCSLCDKSVISQDDDVKREDVTTLEYIVRECPSDYVSKDWPLNFKPSLTAIYDVAGSIFDDFETGDVCFVIRYSAAREEHPRRIYAHSKILATRCDYFKTLFQSGFSENEGMPEPRSISRVPDQLECIDDESDDDDLPSMMGAVDPGFKNDEEEIGRKR